MFRPLPAHLADDQNEICNRLDPKKDVDSMNHLSNAGVYEGRADLGYAPCTAQACMEILDHYGIELKGKNVCVVGHSLVVGRPAALLALNRDATTTQCHIFTRNTPEHTQKADIIIVACGKAGLVTEKWLGEGQIVIDVGINVTAEGKIVGDVDKAAAEAKTAAYSPVPGGVGAVTTSVLMKHVVEAAEKTL
jgi:methylenetetrahydrofolate dehydrogenase (NADP+)/methenyltetrahydrofolate cyclohydrolase